MSDKPLTSTLVWLIMLVDEEAQHASRMPSRNTAGKNFVCVSLRASIVQQEELDWTEIAVIGYLDCLTTGKRGYNIEAGGRGLSKWTKKNISDSKTGKTRQKAVVIKILETEVEFTHTSINDAAKEMGVGRHTIKDLANKKRKQSKCKGAKYFNLFFTAKFND